MQANPNKFQFMVTGNHETQLTLNDQTILDQEDCVKLLGVNVDKQLNEVCKKAGRQLNALRRKSRLLNTCAKMKVFNSFVRANLNYCPLVWINRNKTDLCRLERVQERAIRQVYNDKTSSYCDLLSRARVVSVLTKWQRTLAIEVYKAINGQSPPYIQDLFKIKHTPYDLQASKIVTQSKCKSTTYDLNSLSYQGAKLWNNLPDLVKNAENSK